MTIQRLYLKSLKRRADYLAYKSVNYGLNAADASELRALTWAIDTLTSDADRAQASAARYHEQLMDVKRQEFEERRDERKATKLLRRLREVIVSVTDYGVLNNVDQFFTTRKAHTEAQKVKFSNGPTVHIKHVRPPLPNPHPNPDRRGPANFEDDPD